ncbi:hypothetical protein PENNAL_c0646G03265, partial [Penicillium nalgiovense]
GSRLSQGIQLQSSDWPNLSSVVPIRAINQVRPPSSFWAMGILQNPGRFSSQLRNALASKPFDVWSIPESDADPQDEDCSYDMEPQSYAGDSYVPMDEDAGDGAEADWAMETQSADDHDPEAVPDGAVDAPVSIGKCVSCLRDLDGRVLSVEHQFEKQNLWNDDMARGMKTMQGGYQDISVLREESAMLKKEVAMLRGQLNSLSKGSPATVRRPGRPRRDAE